MCARMSSIFFQNILEFKGCQILIKYCPGAVEVMQKSIYVFEIVEIKCILSFVFLIFEFPGIQCSSIFRLVSMTLDFFQQFFITTYDKIYHKFSNSSTINVNHFTIKSESVVFSTTFILLYKIFIIRNSYFEKVYFTT